MYTHCMMKLMEQQICQIVWGELVRLNNLSYWMSSKPVKVDDFKRPPYWFEKMLYWLWLNRLVKWVGQ